MSTQDTFTGITASDHTSIPPQEWNDDSLLLMLVAVRDKVKAAQSRLDKIEAEVLIRLEARHAKAIMGERFTCELKSRNGYRQEDLAPLKEVFLPEDLGSCYSPAREKTVQVPEHWAIKDVLTLARKYGEAALAVVERARFEEGRKLVLMERGARAKERA